MHRIITPTASINTLIWLLFDPYSHSPSSFVYMSIRHPTFHSHTYLETFCFDSTFIRLLFTILFSLTPFSPSLFRDHTPLHVSSSFLLPSLLDPRFSFPKSSCSPLLLLPVSMNGQHVFPFPLHMCIHMCSLVFHPFVKLVCSFGRFACMYIV